MSAGRSKHGRPSLDDRFDMDRAQKADRIGWSARRWQAVGKDDGEEYTLCLFPKTGSDIDIDLRRLLEAVVRRIRGVLARSIAKDVLVPLIDIVEDDAEIGLRFAASGFPLQQLSTSSQKQLANRAKTTLGRVSIWRAIASLSRALGYLHAADIVHGGIDEAAVFVESISPPEFKLGGYEGSVHVGTTSGASASLLKTGSVVSLRRDWTDLGSVAAKLLGNDEQNGTVLLPSEQRLLDRLRRPAQFAHIDGSAMALEIEELCLELERVGSSERHELVLFPDGEVARKGLALLKLRNGTGQISNGLFEFLSDDLTKNQPLLRSDPKGRSDRVMIFSDQATYTVQTDRNDSRLGRITELRSRRLNDATIDAKLASARIYIANNRKDARDRVARSGGGASSWLEAVHRTSSDIVLEDPPPWHALILSEVFSLLTSRLRHYPVEIVDTKKSGVVRLAPRIDRNRDDWRRKLGRQPTRESLSRELAFDDGTTDWTLSLSDAFFHGQTSLSVSFLKPEDDKGRRLYLFQVDGNLPAERDVVLRPRPDAGTESAIRRRLSNIVSARGNLDLLLALNDPNSVDLDEQIRTTSNPGEPPAELETSKASAWTAIKKGHSLDLVVGPPGVGKTFLVSRLVGSILQESPSSRILITAQNHDALTDMHQKLVSYLAEKDRVIVRIERQDGGSQQTQLRQDTRSLLAALIDGDTDPALSPRLTVAKQAIDPTYRDDNAQAEALLRDTDHLILRSADVTLATANSFAIEEMIADGERFDWVIVEESARATGSELIGPLLLGSRRLLIGDHHQLAPFDAEQRARFYQPEAAAALMEDANELADTFLDLPNEVNLSLEALAKDKSLQTDVLAAAARFEQPFREIAERAEEKGPVTGPKPVSQLIEQSRMHPTICALVSSTFYDGKLETSEATRNRRSTVRTSRSAFSAPITVLDLPSLSITRKRAFEDRVGTSRRNKAEAKAVMYALKEFTPAVGVGQPVTLAILSPFKAQCSHLRTLLSSLIDPKNQTLSGFESPKKDGEFVYTVDGFQGGEADIVIASLVRNNDRVGPGALGFLSDRRRMNVLLSRARHKLVLATSIRFLRNAVSGHDPGGENAGPLQFLDAMLQNLDSLYANAGAVSIVPCDEQGSVQI